MKILKYTVTVYVRATDDIGDDEEAEIQARERLYHDLQSIGVNADLTDVGWNEKYDCAIESCEFLTEAEYKSEKRG
jgi:hypothetical protein